MKDEMLYGHIVVGCRVEFGMVVSASECESAYHVQVSHHVHLDEPSRRWDSVLIGDSKGDEVLPDVVDEPFGQFKWHHCSGCCCMGVSWGEGGCTDSGLAIPLACPPRLPWHTPIPWVGLSFAGMKGGAGTSMVSSSSLLTSWAI